jgi:hypothetical protein
VLRERVRAWTWSRGRVGATTGAGTLGEAEDDDNLLPEDDPGGVVAAVREALAPGSHLVISHAADLPDEQQPPGRAEATRAAAEVYQQLTAPLTLRTPCEIQALFTGFDLIDPGLVCVNQWRPTRSRRSRPVPVLGGVARLGARQARALSR